MGRRSFFAGQAGDPQFDFTRGTIRASMAPPLQLAFQAIDLCQTGPTGIRIEHFTGGDGAKFEAAVRRVGLR